jgi:hypothetical protein
MFHADRQTNTTKLIVVLRCFANAPKNALYEGRAGQTVCELVELPKSFHTVLYSTLKTFTTF